MTNFKQSRVDGYWICSDCGVAVLPLPIFVSDHIKECEKNTNSKYKEDMMLRAMDVISWLFMRDWINGKKRDELLNKTESYYSEDTQSVKGEKDAL